MEPGRSEDQGYPQLDSVFETSLDYLRPYLNNDNKNNILAKFYRTSILIILHP